MELKSLRVLFLATSFICSTAFANCLGTIQNNSSHTWNIKYESGKGNVYFPESLCHTGGPCDIPPHATVNVEYTHSAGFAAGLLIIADYRGSMKSFGYYGFNKNCPTIRKLTSTGGVALNDPSNGSFTFTDDTW